MDSAPGRAQGGDMLGQLGFDLRQFPGLKPTVSCRVGGPA